MEFRRLRLAGFKSFVEPVDLLIEPGLTGVVGPNGCGKSNLLEALRWVMGEGSPKSMRSGGMDDVIFAGTSARPAREFATVTLHLAGSAGEEIEVQRRIQRGAGSDYRLNGRDARAQDVRLLFADSATGAHSPAIVGQGRISAIIAAKPAERRQLLEEAAGIAGLAVRRREAEIRLRAAEANVTRLDDVIRSLETQAGTLRRQAKSAERYRSLSDRIRHGEAALIHARWHTAVALSERARKAAVAAETLAAERTRLAAGLTAEAADANAALPALRQSEAEAAAAAQALRQRRALLDAEAQELARRDAALAASIASIDRDAARETALADDAAAAGERLAAEDAALAERLAALATERPALAERLSLAGAAALAGETALSDAMAAHAAAAAAARAASDAAAAATARAARAEAEAKSLAERLARLAPAPDLEPFRAAVAKAQADVAACETGVTDAEAARPAAETTRSEAAAALSAARATLASLEAEAQALARRLAADQGKTPRIADQLVVAAGYEAALAAALGEDMDAGPASSTAPRRFAGSVAADDPALPAGVVPLAGQVQAPPELARRLAQTGVVDAAPDAPLLAALKPGQRLVSRDGKLWRWDGLVDSGGRTDAAAARLRARRRAAELEAERQAAAGTVEKASATLRDAEAAAAAIAAAERAARQARDAAARLLTEARGRLAQAETAAARAAGEESSLKTSAAQAEADRARLVAEAETARAAVPAADALAGLSVALAAARTGNDTARSALSTARAAVDTAGRDADAAARRRTAIQAEQGDWQRRIAASAGQRSELANRREAAEEERAGLAARTRAIAADLAGLASTTQTADAARAAAADRLAAAESALNAVSARARAADADVGEARELRATARAEAEHQDAARLDLERLCGERFQCPPPLLPGRFGFGIEPGDPAALAESLDALTAERDRLGPVNLRADIELKELEEQALLTASEKAELDTAIARLRGSIGSLNREGRQRLQAAFTAVDGHFRTLFSDLFGGGEAQLALIESDDPLEAGLEIMAQPPGKKLQSLTLLSGGEQALTATALIFALFLSNPAPICVLDEVDAPLDDANVERFCDLLDRMAAETATRFLIVTHNAVSMSRMHRLFGVTMGEPGVSQLVSVDLQTAERLVAMA
ncbi:chromosome segregation SMC family protein [Sandarakinorhabdus limnophila]|uniref:chromosome segregation SMC family protein n=1 Tax=Sandarakinorhabdus limnophila TaxID=210512 RepID=UPI0026EE6F07|nr:AAA family ATPase [Sandarakinorhabdus limnophila]MCM0032595.1 AAA family ATPase [Sandarakinorhabdus limnophila]